MSDAVAHRPLQACPAVLDRGRRDCLHPEAPHLHGTRVAYVTDRCRCTRCRAANRAAERLRTSAQRNGTWQPFVDAGPARQHLQSLREWGLGLDRVAELSKTSRSTVRRLLSPSSPARVKVETANRLLAIEPSPEHLAGRSQVDAADTHTLVRELIAMGYPLPKLAKELSRSSVSLRRTLHRRKVTLRTATEVGNLHNRLQRNDLATECTPLVPGELTPSGDPPRTSIGTSGSMKGLE